MRELILAVITATLGLTLGASAQPAPEPKDQSTRPGTTKPPKSESDLRRFLRTQIEQVEWDDTPFSEVIDWLREHGQVNVVVRWNVLQEQGIDQDSPVSLRLKDVKVATILSEALAQLSQTKELRYLGVGRTLTISTRQDLNKRLYTRAYSVNDLLFRIPDFTDAPSINIQQGGGGGQGSAQQNPFQGGGGGGGGDEDTRSRSERIKDLIETITATVEPESWRENGGEGTIKSFNDSVLVVRACLEVHERLGGPLVLEE
jgi:hypothetical protein